MAEEGQWLYLDQQSSLRSGLLRRLFSCLEFEGSEQVARLADMLDRLRKAHLEKTQLKATVPELTFITKASRQWMIESHRVCRRLIILRELANEQENNIFPRST